MELTDIVDFFYIFVPAFFEDDKEEQISCK